MKRTSIYCAGLLGLTCMSAMAIQIDPTYTTFGTLSGATFGGSGIPNTAVAITSLTSGNYGITLGLTATQRYEGQAPENDGAGTFYAQVGGDTDNAKPSNNNPNYARWNLGYYVNIDPNLPWLNNYSVRLYYDKNPGLDTDVTTYRTLSEGQWSDNLGYGGSVIGIPYGFPTGTFDPNATGEYSFALVVFKNGTELGRSAINVNVNNTGTMPSQVPDGGATLALMGIGLVGMARFARARK